MIAPNEYMQESARLSADMHRVARLAWEVIESALDRHAGSISEDELYEEGDTRIWIDSFEYGYEVVRIVKDRREIRVYMESCVGFQPIDQPLDAFSPYDRIAIADHLAMLEY